MADFYVKYAGAGQVLAQRVAEVLEVSGYFRSDVGYTLVVDADRLIGVPGWAHLDLDPTELGEDGEPGSAEGTAMAPYEYELFLDFRGPFDRLGRVVFHRLMVLGLPLAYCGSGRIFADFLPGRGVREFPPETDVEEPGRSWWYESRLYADPAAPWRREPAPPPAPPGRVIVCDTGGLLQLVPLAEQGGRWRWATPVASIRVDSSPGDIGLMLGAVLATTSPPERADPAVIAAGLVARPGESPLDFGSRSVSIEVQSDGAEVVAFPHAPRRGEPEEVLCGPVVDELTWRSGTDIESTVLGERVLDLLAELRSRRST